MRNAVDDTELHYDGAGDPKQAQDNNQGWSHGFFAWRGDVQAFLDEQ